jgi:cyclin ccl1
MAHFEDTTQAKYWLFTLEQVKEIRTKCNQEASNRFRERVNSTEIEPVKLEEEAKLRRIYEIKIQKYSEKLGLPEKAQATAVTLFKRYFLRTSVMEADLSSISITCLYLASKIEEYYIPFKDFVAIVETSLTAEQLLSFEMDIMQRLEFCISCYHPYLSFSALWSLLEESWWNTQGKEKEGVDKKKLYYYARSLIHKSLLTDVMFFLTPGQIALGVLSFAFSHFHLSFPLDLLLSLKKEKNGGDEVNWLSSWKQCIAELKREMSTCGGLHSWNIPSEEERQQLVNKLALCIDPQVDPTRPEYLELMKKKEEDKEMKRLEKNLAFTERRKREFAMITGIGEGAFQALNDDDVEGVDSKDGMKQTEEIQQESSSVISDEEMKRKRKRK